MSILYKSFSFILILLSFTSCLNQEKEKIVLNNKDHIVLIGNNLCSRMLNFGHLETEMHLAFPEHKLFIRNMCDGGNTPGFRPHSARKSPWAFPGAEEFYTNELANGSNSQGHFPTPDEWLEKLKPNIIIAFFGYNESFSGEDGIENFKAELGAFIDHTLSTKYNGISAPQLVMVSPTKFDDLSEEYDYPDGESINENLRKYTLAMSDVAHIKDVKFIDLFSKTKRWNKFTTDGSQLTSEAYKDLAEELVPAIFKGANAKESHKALVHESVVEKNWMWHNDFKIPNGVHVYGRRYQPFGDENYPAELKKIEEMTMIRDSAIWSATKGRRLNIDSLDQFTQKLAEITTNYNPKNLEDQAYKYGEDYLNTFTMAPGYKIEIFASEEDFPDLANPCQMSFDDKGRLWVAVMPTYPHYKPGDGKPNDKILILEDTDNDGKADKQIIYAENLHIPVGFEIAHDGVYVSQGTNLKFLRDTDGDDRADEEEILLSGFDDHDTHHTTSAFCTDPSGAIYMGEGVFLHSNVETSYGPVRATNGGFFRFNPQQKKLERTGNLPIPNPWGTAFDQWGENFFIETSGPNMFWMMPSTVKSRYGDATPLTKSLIVEEHKVRPTSGLEFVSSRHFPDEVQGDFMLNNTIGFLGTKQHYIKDEGTGYETGFRQDLLRSTDGNFRPVDLEFAPDGSLYIVDWHNVLVGHMQHNARDPLRDHVHGRVLRVTYPARPLVEPAKIHDANLEELFANLKLPEYRTRYRTRRALRGHDKEEVFSALQEWKKDQENERHLLEGLWVSWGINKIDENLLNELLKAEDFRVRAAAVRVVRYNMDKLDNAKELLLHAADDEEGRVRLEALVAASWMPQIDGIDIFNLVDKHPVDEWTREAYRYGLAHMNDENASKEFNEKLDSKLKGDELASFRRGKEIYGREGFCTTCHQEQGKGVEASGFPPLKDSEWVLKDEEVLIKLTLKGLLGPITVAGKQYPGQVPMPPYEKMLTDQEIADVLTYVRNAFGNNASVIEPITVKKIREEEKNKTGYYSPEEIVRVYQIQ